MCTFDLKKWINSSLGQKVGVKVGVKAYFLIVEGIIFSLIKCTSIRHYSSYSTSYIYSSMFIYYHNYSIGITFVGKVCNNPSGGVYFIMCRLYYFVIKKKI